VTKKVKMFPKVHLRIIPSLGKWIWLAPKPIKINGKRGSLFCQKKNLLTSLKGGLFCPFQRAERTYGAS
jgi:hypothetical protein